MAQGYGHQQTGLGHHPGRPPLFSQTAVLESPAVRQGYTWSAPRFPSQNPLKPGLSSATVVLSSERVPGHLRVPRCPWRWAMPASRPRSKTSPCSSIPSRRRAAHASIRRKPAAPSATGRNCKPPSTICDPMIRWWSGSSTGWRGPCGNCSTRSKRCTAARSACARVIRPLRIIHSTPKPATMSPLHHHLRGHCHVT